MTGERLIALFERKYGSRVLAELLRQKGARVAPLAHQLEASRVAIRATLADLAARGWVEPNPGHGHPLRPEWILTAAGRPIARQCAALDELLDDHGWRSLAASKWPLPVLHTIGRRGARFSEITTRLPRLTDRALSLSLQDLAAADL
ncbi:MAG: winged helix-turn-helix transcriptional regulator, partial [Gemmatimonadetes bacterium]|nr:winged helix-turn-helix transcriptional regulator [Gemmatimonadota bacterium]